MSFRPQAGMRCVTRNGQVTSPVEDDGPEYLWPILAEVNGRHEAWTAEGRYWTGGPLNPFDLVREFVEPQAISWDAVRAAVREAA